MKLIFSIFFLGFCFGIETHKSNSQKIKFTEAWVWEYHNENIAKDEFGHKGEMVIYHEPKQDYWLFTVEAYGVSGEMFDWIIGKPEGTFLMYASDEFGRKTIREEKLEFSDHKTFPKHYKPAKIRKVFNQNNLGFPKIDGKEFKVDYLKTEDRTSLFIGDYKADFLPLYFFNHLNTEAKLPVRFPIDFPHAKLLLEENSTVNKAKIWLRLKEISHTEYFIDIKTP